MSHHTSKGNLKTKMNAANGLFVKIRQILANENGQQVVNERVALKPTPTGNLSTCTLILRRCATDYEKYMKTSFIKYVFYQLPR